MRVKRWPNGLGYDVGSATVMDGVRCLVVCVPVGPRVGPDLREVKRVKLCRVPTGTDPLEAVRLCRVHGAVFEPFQAGEIPFVDF